MWTNGLGVKTTPLGFQMNGIGEGLGYLSVTTIGALDGDEVTIE